ncbi:hypothetical protein [Tenacibaculum sp.]|uniref:hypothetical protein n=1 Tax=Tenacibaculum sp. TaxID=1906242 RepID=UPI003D0E7960
MNTYKQIFLLVLGSVLMVIPFYASSMNMLLLSEKTAEWTSTHWIFFGLGSIVFAWGIGGIKKISELALKWFSSLTDKNTKK